jgi:hypothetical protein
LSDIEENGFIERIFASRKGKKIALFISIFPCENYFGLFFELHDAEKIYK